MLSKVKTKLTKKQVERFIKRVLVNKDAWFNVVMFTDTSKWAFGAMISVAEDDTGFLLELNTSLNSDIRCLLLHEVGHFECESKHHKSVSERELSAQIWAIRRAKQLGWNKIHEEMKCHLKHRWRNFKWNSPYRIYVMASKLAEERKMV